MRGGERQNVSVLGKAAQLPLMDHAEALSSSITTRPRSLKRTLLLGRRACRREAHGPSASPALTALLRGSTRRVVRAPSRACKTSTKRLQCCRTRTVSGNDATCLPLSAAAAAARSATPSCQTRPRRTGADPSAVRTTDRRGPLRWRASGRGFGEWEAGDEALVVCLAARASVRSSFQLPCKIDKARAVRDFVSHLRTALRPRLALEPIESHGVAGPMRQMRSRSSTGAMSLAASAYSSRSYRRIAGARLMCLDPFSTPYPIQVDDGVADLEPAPVGRGSADCRHDRGGAQPLPKTRPAVTTVTPASRSMSRGRDGVRGQGCFGLCREHGRSNLDTARVRPTSRSACRVRARRLPASGPQGRHAGRLSFAFDEGNEACGALTRCERRNGAESSHRLRFRVVHYDHVVPVEAVGPFGVTR